MEACIGSTWGAIADNIQDAPTCVRGCRDSLRRLLAPSDETFESFCRTLVQLEQPQMDDMLLGLYCCDSQLCGVDNIGLPGFDPNVDFIINVCSSLGFEPLRDPGPPAPTHVCINTILPSSDIACSRTTIFTSPTSSASVSQTQSSSTTTTTPSTTTTLTGTDSTTSTSSSSGSTTPTSTAMTSTSGTGAARPKISSLDDPRLSENISGGSKPDTSGGLSTASKIIIAAAVSGAILVALIAVLWHCRYRRKNKEPEPSNERQPSLVMAPPNDASPTSQLVSPSPSYLGPDGGPLTPPPRLKERRLLPTGSSEQLIDRAPSRLRQGFHLPTASRADAGSPYGSTVGPSVAVGAAAAGALATIPRSPGSSSPNLTRSPFLSPTRSQFAPISYASSLADPGPPPDRELPNTPVRAATAQSRSRARTDVSPNAIGVALEFPPREDDLSTQVSDASGVSSESKIMTGPMRGSWGDSWVASEDEEPAAASTLRKPAARRTSRSPILEEQDLARMAGSY